MNKGYIGIDIGTSSVKVLFKAFDGSVQKAKSAYKSNTPEGWYDATVYALSQIDASKCSAIGLTSQVGTYITESEIIGWSDKAGQAEVKEIKSTYPKQKFIDEISMAHPDITSYPIPRLKYIQKKYGAGISVCQPKDYMCKMLTGSLKTDKYSWRGLANIKTGKYSQYFLNETGNPQLPEIAEITECIGTVCDEVCTLTGIPKNTPVYVGLNDFYASLLGMGIFEAGDMFDITGTSEHLGVIDDKLCEDTNMVSGPYINNYVHYGVTGSSGASLDFGIKSFDLSDFELNESLIKNAPVFTPYLNGERAPIFDSNANGMFYGITSLCTKEHLAYAVAEGVVFSIYHIYEHLNKPKAKKLTVSGGASQSNLLNYLKAEMFEIPVQTLNESDTSALGALICAAVGNGAFATINDASKHYLSKKNIIMPDGRFKNILHKRYEIYKDLYPSVKNLNNKFKEVQL